MTLRIFIADDEPPARARLSALVKELGHEVCAETGDALSVEKILDSVQPDVILLDIKMPGLDGIELALRIKHASPQTPVILVTAHSEHALDAFDASATDYILKPVRKERLAMAFKKIERLRSSVREMIPQLIVTIGRKEQLVALDELDCFVAEQGYVLARSATREGFINASLHWLETRYRDQLLRVHRSCLVVRTAIAGIKTQSAGQHSILFRDGLEPVPISRRHLKQVRQYLQSFTL